MEIIRHCSERLPGGERRWRRLARRAGFTGRVEVYGYGAGGDRLPAVLQRKAAKRNTGMSVRLGDFSSGVIRVWMNGPCEVADADEMHIVLDPDHEPLGVFAHELGHYDQWSRDPEHFHNERRADRYGRALLRQEYGR